MEQFLNKLTLGSKIAVGAFVVGFISCFFPWYSWSVSSGELGGFSMRSSASATAYFGGVLFFVLCQVGVLAVVLPAVSENPQLTKPPMGFAVLGVAGLSLLSILVVLLQVEPPRQIVSTVNASSGLGFGWYLAFIAVLAALAGGALRAKELNLLGGGGSPADSTPPPAPPGEPM